MILGLPYPPSVNHYWHFAFGKAYVTKHGLKFRHRVDEVVLLEKLRGVDRRFSFRDPLSMEVMLLPPDRRERDVDNAGKAILDALAFANVYESDSQVKRLTFDMLPPKRGGLAIVQIRRFEP